MSYNRTAENKFLEDFFSKMEEDFIALTFEDVKIRTQHSDIMPDDAKVDSYFSRNVPLKVPISSAAMDKVTESKAAIAMAKFGGIGVIHRGLSIDDQASEVKRVKTYMNGLISSPITISPENKMSDVEIIMQNNEFNFHTFPVVNSDNQLKGVLTETDFQFCDDLEMQVAKCMTQGNLVFGNQNTTLNQAYDIMRDNKIKFLPLINTEGVLTGVYTLSDVKRVLNADDSSCNMDTNGQLRVAAAIGIKDYDRAVALIQSGVDALVIDTAHGDTSGMVNDLKYLKNKYDVDIIAGNISEPEGIRELIKAGADGIKIGQGPGSICTTRIVTGVGAPQLSAIYRCASEVMKHDSTVTVIADGGIKYSGEIPMAIGAGAASVMMGSLLAGADESPGEIVMFNGQQFKTYRGMGSVEAMQNSAASRERYGQKDTAKDAIVPEGIEGLTPYKGRLQDVLTQYKVGLQRSMGYFGARNIHELQSTIKFHRITAAGAGESHPHDVVAVKDSPNYRK